MMTLFDINYRVFKVLFIEKNMLREQLKILLFQSLKWR